jgi:hypothetical protein
MPPSPDNYLPSIFVGILAIASFYTVTSGKVVSFLIFLQIYSFWVEAPGFPQNFAELMQQEGIRLKAADVIKPLTPSLPPAEFFNREDDLKILHSKLETRELWLDPRKTLQHCSCRRLSPSYS